MTEDGEAVGKHHPIETYMLVKLPNDGPVFGTYSHRPDFPFFFQVKQSSVRFQDFLEPFYPSGNAEKDLQYIKSQFKNIKGLADM